MLFWNQLGLRLNVIQRFGLWFHSVTGINCRRLGQIEPPGAADFVDPLKVIVERGDDPLDILPVFTELAQIGDREHRQGMGCAELTDGGFQ